MPKSCNLTFDTVFNRQYQKLLQAQLHGRLQGDCKHFFNELFQWPDEQRHKRTCFIGSYTSDIVFKWGRP